MSGRLAGWVLSGAVLAAGWGCQPESTPATTSPAAPAATPSAPAAASAAPAASTAPPASTAPSAAAAPGGDGKGNGSGSGRKDGEGGGRGSKRASVYLDGARLGVLRFGELPPQLATTWLKRETSEGGTLEVRRFRLADYFEALGVDLKKVRFVHLYGGRDRVAVLTGAELLKRRADLLFSFTQSDGGKPRMHWPKDIAVTDRIDMVGDVALYATRPAPTWNAELQRIEVDAQPVSGVPGVEPIGGGTRLYVDGRLVKVLQRRGLGEPSGDPPRWGLGRLLLDAGVRVSKVKAVDLVDGDAIARRLEPEAVGATTFEMPPGSHGRMTIQPDGLPTEAVLVHVAAPPPPSSAR